jgi:penicillin amidase
VIELSNPIVGENILPPGQSEDPTSPHFSDQRDLSSWWLFKPMQLELTP